MDIFWNSPITKCVKTAICILSFIQLAPKLMPCFWSIFTDFQNEVFSSNLNISAKYEPKQAFYGSKFRLDHCKWKTIPILEIKDLAFMLRSMKQRAFFYSPGNCKIHVSNLKSCKKKSNRKILFTDRSKDGSQGCFNDMQSDFHRMVSISHQANVYCCIYVINSETKYSVLLIAFGEKIC